MFLYQFNTLLYKLVKNPDTIYLQINIISPLYITPTTNI